MWHCVDAEEVYLLKENTKSIENAPVLYAVSELRLFLTVLNYYGRFIPNLATLIAETIKWVWMEKEHKTFEGVKKKLVPVYW